MDWISGSVEGEEFVVVTDEDLLEIFQSPDVDDEENNQQVLMFEDEQGEFSIQESEQSISSCATGEWFPADLQFNDHNMGSMLEPGMLETENNNIASHHLSFEPQFSSTPTDLNFDLQSSFSNNASIGINYNLAGKVFHYSSYGISNGDYYENNASGCSGGQALPEEQRVLYELGMAMARLPESTRLCFRDSFYRLSYNSIQDTQTQADDDDDERIRSPEEESGTAESGTGFIDRVVDSFMFNN